MHTAISMRTCQEEASGFGINHHDIVQRERSSGPTLEVEFMMTDQLRLVRGNMNYYTVRGENKQLEAGTPMKVATTVSATVSKINLPSWLRLC